MNRGLRRALVDRSIGELETRVVGALRLENRYPPLFIVGAPRSGTTLVYQHLAYRFRFAYLPNLARDFPRSCVSCTALARLLPAPGTRYASRFGVMEGAAAPSDGWDVFHRWFPRYDYSVPVAGDRLHELRTIVRILEKLYGGPFLNKNNSHSVRVSPLSDLFPRALFVHVDRDLPATVDSILRGRRQSGIPESEWWGAPPPQLWERQFENETERTVAQVWGLRETVRRDFAALPESRRRVVRYEEFCDAPGAVEAWVEDTYAKLGVELRRTDTALPSRFDVRRSDRAAEPEFRRSVESTADRFAEEDPRRG